MTFDDSFGSARRAMEEGRVATFYTGRWYCFDNFSAFAVELGGKLWPTAEHAYQGAKFEDPNLSEEIRSCRSAHVAKQLARHNDRFKRPGWNLVNLDVMEGVLRAKLEQHEYVRRRLRESAGLILVEDSSEDDFWGRGLAWTGENHLGRLWMKLRDEMPPADRDASPTPP